ncbi:hypothetical protein JL721_5771 [Aureococcus anophagefferens]|nr:hypothetical protein JL721_5771 [Aureococcus anophagefferens]
MFVFENSSKSSKVARAYRAGRDGPGSRRPRQIQARGPRPSRMNALLRASQDPASPARSAPAAPTPENLFCDAMSPALAQSTSSAGAEPLREAARPSAASRPSASGAPRSAGRVLSTGRWTAEEHEEFIKCLAIYGREWKKVSERITTRTAAQIRSHAQKYFKKIQSGARASRRRRGRRRPAAPAAAPAPEVEAPISSHGALSAIDDMLRQLRKKRIALCDAAAADARSANVPRCSPDGSPALSPAPSEDDEAAAPNAENAAPPADDATAVSCEDRSPPPAYSVLDEGSRSAAAPRPGAGRPPVYTPQRKIAPP